jgi:ubiquinone/menaquinone biosynthesis C-methylase UbiE
VLPSAWRSSFDEIGDGPVVKRAVDEISGAKSLQCPSGEKRDEKNNSSCSILHEGICRGNSAMSLHFLWRLLYRRFAFLFDFATGLVSRGKWMAWGRTSMSYLQGGRVLELAHGPGHLLLSLKRAGYQPFGIDLSPSMGKQATRRLRQAGCEVPLVRCRAQALPFRSESFDDVIATFPTDYILDPGTIGEVARVTSRQGRLIIVAGGQKDSDKPNPRFLDWLSKMTGQTESSSNSAFQRAGLSVRFECQPVEGGLAILIIAEKMDRLDRETAALSEKTSHPTRTDCPGSSVTTARKNG